MTSDLVPVSVVRQMIKAAIDETLGRTRIPKVLSGAIEDIDTETLDVAYVRMDFETMGADPTQSDNWGSPGVIAVNRYGASQAGDQVRVGFDGTAGGSASASSAPFIIVLPSGAESGNRIILDGTQGLIIIGDPGPPPGARIELDPVGGIRIRSANDQLVGLIDQQGYTIRDDATGLVNAEITGDTFRLVDPTGTDDIEMTTSSIGTLPIPKYKSATEGFPGTTVVVPADTPFTTAPADDYELYHAAYAIAGTSQTATMTPPAGTTERVDNVFEDGSSTLHVGISDRDPATGVAGTFTNSLSNWIHAVGTSVIVRGGGPTSPSFRSLQEATFGPTDNTQVTATVTKPAGVVQGDALVALISMHNANGSVPLGWTTPEGWRFLGAGVQVATAQTVAVGAWVKLAGASEPADYTITVSFGPGSKRIHACIVAVQNPDLIAGGAHIRMAGHPIRRLLAQNELTSPSQTLCDFTNIPPGYDNLELVYDTNSDQNGDTAARRIKMNYNGSAATDYFWRVTQDGVDSGNANSTTRVVLGQINGNASNSKAAGSVHIFGYSRTSGKQVSLGRGWWVGSGPACHTETFDGQWDGAAAVNRVGVVIEAGTVRFNTGSRAYLYGY